MIIKKLLTIAIGVSVVAVLFLGIGHVIKEPAANNDGKERVDLSFLRTIRPSDLNERERQKPKKPPKAQKQPDIPKPKVAKMNKPNPSNMNMKAMPLDLGLDLGGGPAIGGVGSSAATGTADTDLVPIVKVNPQYPRSAAMKGLQGYVRLTVDIQKDGTVTNARVVDSNPRRVFDRAAVSAASKYRYKPPVIDGKPQVVEGHRIQIDFRIDGR